LKVGLAGIAVVGETPSLRDRVGRADTPGEGLSSTSADRNTIEASGPYGILSILSGRMGLFAVKKILVTGSAGVIGTALVKDLVKQGMVVGGLDREQAGEFTGAAVNYACDILDRARLMACVTEFTPDAIVHLAARTDFDGKDVSGYAANIEGVSNLVEAIRATPSVTRCIWTSTQLVCRVGYVPTGPSDYQPDTVYGRSKVHTEEIVRASDGAGREWCLVRPTTVWGPGVNLHYQRFLKLVKLGLFFHVDPGPLYKSYGYIGNITHQYIRLLHAPAEIIHGRTLYLADYSPIDLVSWCNAFQRCFGARPIPVLPRTLVRMLALTGDAVGYFGIRRVPFNSFRLNNMLTQYRFDMRETEAICGPLPYTIEDGVRITADWINSHSGNVVLDQTERE
jgi:nucleoside-diphosphate-sugar epimerase